MEGWIVDIIVPERSACWQSYHTENKNRRVGWEGKTYKCDAGEHSSTHLRPSQTLLLVFTPPLESHNGYPHPVSLVPPGLCSSILWPLDGRSSYWLAIYLANVLVVPLGAPFLHALVQLVWQWPQWGKVKFVKGMLTKYSTEPQHLVLWYFNIYVLFLLLSSFGFNISLLSM